MRRRTSATRATCSHRSGSGRRGIDGWVSLEVDPTLAYDRDATFAQATRFHAEVARPNLYVKIPATEPGLGAIEDSIAAGSSINVTLIFGLERYAAVVEAYLRGLERLVEAGGDPGSVLSVASFFVSRVDTEADRGSTRSAGRDLKGKLAVANAKLAYRHWQEAFSGDRWAALASEGRAAAALPLGLDLHEEPGLPRRPLRRGAGRARRRQHDAAGDDPRVPGPRRGRGDTLEQGVDEAEQLLDELAAAGVDYDDVSRRSSARACRSSPTPSRSCSTASQASCAWSPPR